MDKLTDEELNAYAAHAFNEQDLPLMAMVMELQNARITLAQHGAFVARAESRLMQIETLLVELRRCLQ